MSELSQMPWKDIVTISAASVGAILGIMNTWNAMNQKRVRLKVVPSFAFTTPGMAEMFAIEVINLSSFPVTVHEIGFTLDSNRANRGPRAAIPIPFFPDQKPWPRRLEAREAVTGYFETPSDMLGKIGQAYAKTSCGEVRYGTNPALKQLKARLQS